MEEGRRGAKRHEGTQVMEGLGGNCKVFSFYSECVVRRC